MRPKRLIRSAAAALALLALLSGPAAAGEVPAGPRLAVSQFGPGFATKVFTVGPTGAERQMISERTPKQSPAILAGATWSPDGSRLVATGLTSLRPTETGSILKQLYLLAADGGKPQPLKGTAGGSDPTFAPDGHAVAFAKGKFVLNFEGDDVRTYESTSIWINDLDTGRSRQLTPWRNHLHQYPSSFSPDGSVLAVTRTVADKPPEAIGINLDGSAASALVRGSATDPTFSPDGTRIAFLRERHRREGLQGQHTDLYTVRYGGGGELRRLTRTPKVREANPSWDPSGQRLSYMTSVPVSSIREALGASSQIWTINADGTCATELLDLGQVLLGSPAWQPGPGREAGPLSC